MESSIFVLDPIKGVFWPFKVDQQIYLTPTVISYVGSLEYLLWYSWLWHPLEMMVSCWKEKWRKQVRMVQEETNKLLIDEPYYLHLNFLDCYKVIRRMNFGRNCTVKGCANLEPKVKLGFWLRRWFFDILLHYVNLYIYTNYHFNNIWTFCP